MNARALSKDESLMGSTVGGAGEVDGRTTTGEDLVTMILIRFSRMYSNFQLSFFIMTLHLLPSKFKYNPFHIWAIPFTYGPCLPFTGSELEKHVPKLTAPAEGDRGHHVYPVTDTGDLVTIILIRLSKIYSNFQLHIN